MGEQDDRLVIRAVNGDHDALNVLLKRHGPQVRRGLKISPAWRSSVDAKDVMQVTYVEAFLQIGNLRNKTADGFVAWLRQVADNNLRDAIKAFERLKRPDPRRKLEPARGTDSHQTLLEAVGASSSTASKHAAAHEARARLEAAIALLPPTYQQVVRLYDLAGESADQVGRTLDRTAGAVYMLRARAHDRLRQLLGPESDFFSHTA